MVKFVDMTWIADKSLDLYCEISFGKGDNTASVHSNAKTINKYVNNVFNEVFDTAVSEYSKKYDKVLIAVPCFPITRMSSISVMTRFLCKNTEFLADNGISSSQFQECFEKFISLKCKNEYITEVGERAWILNSRGILLSDWKNEVIEKFGSSLVDSTKDFPFESNPNFIVNFEENDNIKDKFTVMSSEEKFKIGIIIENLTKN